MTKTPLSAYHRFRMFQLEVVIPNLTFEAVIFILAFIALGSCLYLVTQFGQGALIIPFTHFGSGIIFLGLSRAFLFLANMGVYSLEQETLDLWQHIIFYLAMGSFIWGGVRLRQIATMPASAGYMIRDFYLLVALFLVEFLVFGLAQPLNGILSPVLASPLIKGLGLTHIVSLILVAIAGSQIYAIKSDWAKLLPVGLYPILTFFIILGTKHTFELLNNNWQLVTLPIDVFLVVDQFLLILAFLSLTFGFLRISAINEQVRAKVLKNSEV